MVNWLVKFRTATHFITAGIVAAAVWVITNPKIVDPIVAKYPKLAAVSTAAGVILALYHSPVAK